MTRVDRPTVVVICGDPGGASAMAPMVERLQAGDRVIARAFAYREARSLWNRAGLAFEEMPETISEEVAVKLLLDERAAALAVGTSVNPVGLEKTFVRAARRVGTPSLALLDFWSSYVNRFSDASGTLSSVPDLIAVMDDTARAEMLELGFDPARLVVTGQPAFDALPSVRSGFSASTRRRIRRTLGVSAGALLVAFVSQPLGAVYGSTPSVPGYLGFTEQDVLAALVTALQKVSQRGARVVLAVLPHPREGAQTFERLHSGVVPTVVSRQHSPREVLMSSDLVVGMNSVLLMEACYLGRPTLSLQPGLRQADTLPTNRLGISKAVYDAADIESVVADLLLNDESRRRLSKRTADFQVAEGNAAERVAELIYGMATGELVRPDRPVTANWKSVSRN